MSKRKTRQETGQHGFTVDLNESLYERFIQTIPVGAKIKVIASIALEMWCRLTPDERYDAMMLLGPDDLARKIEQAFALVAQLEGRQAGPARKRCRGSAKPA